MNSVFEKARNVNNVNLLTRENLEREVEGSVKAKVKPNPVRNTVRLVAILLFGLLLGLYFMDPFVYPIEKTKAMRSLVYLNLYSDKASVNELAASPIFKQDDVERLLHKDGDYTRFFPGGTREAKASGQSAVEYMQELEALREGKVEELSGLNRLRYYMFVSIGLKPPQYWSALNPDVSDIQPPLKPGQFFRLEKRNDRLEYTGVGSGK